MEDIASLELLIKTRYGVKHLNSLGQLLETELNGVSDMIYVLHSGAWNHLWKSYVSEYNPIWNVDGKITDTETRDLVQKHTGTDTTTHTGNDTFAKSGSDTFTQGGTITNNRSGSDTSTKTGSQTDTHTGTESVESSYQGFGSNAKTPTTGETTTPNKTDTETYNNIADTTQYNSGNTETRDTTDTTSYNSTNTNTKNLTDQDTHNTENTDKGTVSHVTARQGNIGVTMTSQMLRDDTEYWSDIKALFYEHVIKDIIGDICYKIYVDC